MAKKNQSPTKPLIIQRTYDAPIYKVWAAITDPVQMKEWYFDLSGFRAEVGCEFQFEGGTPEKTYLHLCKVTEVVPGRRLSYSWRYDGYGGNSYVTFDLFPKGEKTQLRLTHRGIETFPSDNPDLVAENFKMGWTELIGTSLKEFLKN